MVHGLLARLRELIEGNPDVTKVANDPALMAELLLLFRIILADGEASEEELAAFRRICAEAFGIEGENLDLVLGHLQDFGYEISLTQSIAVFRELGRERRVALARHMAEIAKADAHLSAREVRLIARVIDLLDLDAKDVVPGPAGAGGSAG